MIFKTKNHIVTFHLFRILTSGTPRENLVVFRKGSGDIDDAGWKAVMQLSEIINIQKCVPVFSQKKKCFNY